MVKYNALLLKKVKYGDKNLILQTYTRESGTISFFLHSLKNKGKTKMSLPPLCILDIVAEKGKGDMKYVKEITFSSRHFNLISNLYKSSMVLFINEVLLKTIRDYQVDDDLFEFILNSLDTLDQNQYDEPNFHLKFLVDFSKHLGFYPNGQFSENNTFFDLYEGHFSPNAPIHKAFIGPDLCWLFAILVKSSPAQCAGIKMNNGERRALLSHLLDYYKIHIESFDELRSREILETVFA